MRLEQDSEVVDLVILDQLGGIAIAINEHHGDMRPEPFPDQLSSR